jgi:hypothetical protein
VTDRAATQADGPLSKRGVAKLEAAMRGAMAARDRGEQDKPIDVDKTQLDATQRDGVTQLTAADLARDPRVDTGNEAPRLPTDPERAVTKAQSMEMMRTPWWRRRPGMMAIGGAVVAIAIVVMLARRVGDPEIAASATPPPQPERVATASAKPVAPPTVSRTATSCEMHATARAWDELMACADRLSDAEAARAARTRAVLELRNKDIVAKLTDALASKHHAEALMWLERVDDTSVYRDEAVAAFATALPRPEAPLPTCNAAQVTEAAKKKVSSGQYRAALVDIEASLRCAPDPSLYRLGALAACNGRNPAKARQFANRLPAAQLTTIRQICLRNGVEHVGQHGLDQLGGAGGVAATRLGGRPSANRNDDLGHQSASASSRRR